jgi:hypothetical protein
MWRARFGRGFGPAVRQTAKFYEFQILHFLQHNSDFTIETNKCAQFYQNYDNVTKRHPSIFRASGFVKQ